MSSFLNLLPGTEPPRPPLQQPQRRKRRCRIHSRMFHVGEYVEEPRSRLNLYQPLFSSQDQSVLSSKASSDAFLSFSFKTKQGF